VLGLLTEFVEELRAIGVPVSMVETLDASDALRHVDLADPEALKAALGATLVKNERHHEAFRVAFDVFFGLKARPPDPDDVDDAVRTDQPGIPGGASAGVMATAKRVRSSMRLQTRFGRETAIGSVGW